MSRSLDDLASAQGRGSDDIDDAAAPVPPLRVDLLQTFVVAACELSMAVAARRLHLSPSGLSRRIKALEAELGHSLFERHTRTMRLTPTGAVLLPYARDIVTAVREAVTASTSVPSLRLLSEGSAAQSEVPCRPLPPPADRPANP